MSEISSTGAAGREISRLQADMSKIIERDCAGAEDHVTAISNLRFFRRENLTQPCPCLVEPSIVFVTQGAKQLLIGERAYPYDASQFLLTAMELPGNSQVLEATPERPSLGITLRLDLRIVADLLGQIRAPAIPNRLADESAAIGKLTERFLEPFSRLLALLSEPHSIKILGPMIEREIHYRLLETDLAPYLMHVVSIGSQSNKITRATDWLKSNYRSQFRMEELVAHVQMSESSLHQHFRQLTGMSPLQYQKWLRLNEARRLMLNERMDAADAGFRVGYESPSQFSREYSRMFGLPPKKDIAGVRSEAGKRALPAG